VIGLERKIGRPGRPEIAGRHGLDDTQPVHAIRMVERQPVTHPRAAIVAQHMGPSEAQRIHKPTMSRAISRLE
jgi:hypothetical protein